MFEWYDFYLYGSLAAIISKQFFSGVNETTGFIFALLAFAAGFAVRPFGALVFGRLGDLVGRKHTFLITIVIMGLSTALVGLLPSYAEVGVAAPVALVVLRLLQGLALGGEYGGAATYVGEHAPPGQAWPVHELDPDHRDSWPVPEPAGHPDRAVPCLKADFDTWGWRIPFLLSFVLLGISVYIRLQLAESPVFLEMKAAGTRSKAPLTESLPAGATCGWSSSRCSAPLPAQAVVWYCGQFYALFFLTQVAEGRSRNRPTCSLRQHCCWRRRSSWCSAACRIASAARKWCCSAVCLPPSLTSRSSRASRTSPIRQSRAPRAIHRSRWSPIPTACSFQFDPVGKKKFVQSCDIAKAALAKAGVPYSNQAGAVGSVARIISVMPRRLPSSKAAPWQPRTSRPPPRSSASR